MIKKILAMAAVLFSVPAFAFAGFGMMAEKCGGYMGSSMVWAHVLGLLVLAIWGVVGVLAAVWLWEHVSHHHRK